jgi:hypothetical protein
MKNWALDRELWHGAGTIAAGVTLPLDLVRVSDGVAVDSPPLCARILTILKARYQLVLHAAWGSSCRFPSSSRPQGYTLPC